MRAAVVVFLAAAAFLAAVLLGPVRVGSSARAPRVIELRPATGAAARAAPRAAPVRSQVRKEVEAGSVAGYAAPAGRANGGRGR